MNKIFVEMATLFILLLYMFQPQMEEIYQVKAHAIELVLNSTIQKAGASDNGYFTPELIKEMKDKLNNSYLIDSSAIVFKGTTTLTPRGEYVEGQLTVKSPQRWLFASMMGGTDNKAIIRYARIMSEHLVRD